MNQRLYRIFTLLFILFLGANMFYYLTASTNYPKPQFEIDPYLGQVCLHAKIYYVDGSKLSYEMIDPEPKLGYGLNQLLEFYQHQTAEHADDLDVIDLYEEQNRIYLNLGKNAFRSPKYHEKNIALYIMSVVNTLTEKQPQKQVQLLFDSKILKEKIRGFDVQRPIERDESLVYTSEEDILKLYEDFINELMISDDFSANGVLSFHESGVIRPSELRQQLIDYKEKAMDYSARVSSIQKTKAGWQVTVKATGQEGPIEESWEIVRIGKRYFINYARSPMGQTTK